MTGNQFVMVSEWMKNGNIGEFVRTHADVNPMDLVRILTEVLILACY